MQSGACAVADVDDSTIRNSSTQTYNVEVVAVPFPASPEPRTSGADLRGRGKQLPFRLPDSEKLYVAIFGDNPLLMQSRVESSGGRVVFSATAGTGSWQRRSEVSKAFKRHTDDALKTLVWVQWGEGLDKAKYRVRREAMQGCSAWLKRQSEDGGLAFMCALGDHWPFDKDSIWSSTAMDLASCKMGLDGPCRKFKYISNFVNANNRCQCAASAVGASSAEDCTQLFVGIANPISSIRECFTKSIQKHRNRKT